MISKAKLINKWTVIFLRKVKLKLNIRFILRHKTRLVSNRKGQESSLCHKTLLLCFLTHQFGVMEFEPFFCKWEYQIQLCQELAFTLIFAVHLLALFPSFVQFPFSSLKFFFPPFFLFFVYYLLPKNKNTEKFPLKSRALISGCP